MGNNSFDQYSFLHFCVGGVLFYWNISFIPAIILHILFEYLENTKLGIKFINKYFTSRGLLRWPGGKYKADTLMNNIVDTIFFALGWFIAYYINELGIEYGWYNN